MVPNVYWIIDYWWFFWCENSGEIPFITTKPNHFSVCSCFCNSSNREFYKPVAETHSTYSTGLHAKSSCNVTTGMESTNKTMGDNLGWVIYRHMSHTLWHQPGICVFHTWFVPYWETSEERPHLWADVSVPKLFCDIRSCHRIMYPLDINRAYDL